MRTLARAGRLAGCRPVAGTTTAVNPPISSAMSGSRTAKFRLVHCSSAPSRAHPANPSRQAAASPMGYSLNSVKICGACQRHEHAAQCAARGNRQVERREVARRRPRPRQFPVAHHATNEQRGQIDQQLQSRAIAQSAATCTIQPAGRARPRHSETDPMVDPVPLERQHESQQIDRQRRHPQEWIHRDLLRDLVGGRQQERRTGMPKAPARTAPSMGRGAGSRSRSSCGIAARLAGLAAPGCGAHQPPRRPAAHRHGNPA